VSSHELTPLPFAIAAVVDMLSGVLTGSGFLSAVHSPYKTAEKSNCGHMMIAMNIEVFQPLAQFNERIEQFIAEIKAVPLAKGYDEVFYPGEMEARNDERNRRDGLALPEATRADLARIAKLTGLELKLPFGCYSSSRLSIGRSYDANPKRTSVLDPRCMVLQPCGTRAELSDAADTGARRIHARRHD
jgi:malate/lactate dehydrogenase-like protein